MHTRLASAFIALSLVASFAVPAAEAARKPVTPASTYVKYDPANSTTAYVGSVRIWLPGIWQVANTPTSATMVRRDNGVETATVSIVEVPKEDCQYQVIRQEIMRAWNTGVISQEQAKIETLIVGSSRLRGYSWVIPTENGRDMHWCLPQDGKTNVEITAPYSDKKLVDFIRGNLILQLAVRRSRR